jgi:hypothetical protein
VRNNDSWGFAFGLNIALREKKDWPLQDLSFHLPFKDRSAGLIHLSTKP